MAAVKITSPIKGFNGAGVYGSTTLAFSDGVAEVAELSPGLRGYLERRGYTVTGVKTRQPAKTKADDPKADESEGDSPTGGEGK